jgi:hypothetical protein
VIVMNDRELIIRDCIDSLIEVNEELIEYSRAKKITDLLDRAIRELEQLADTIENEAEDRWG